MKKFWYEESASRLLVDMHIPDWDEKFFHDFSAETYAERMAQAHVDTVELYAGSCLGLCNYPTDVGYRHRCTGSADLLGALTRVCRAGNLRVVLYLNVWNRKAYDEHPEWRLIHHDGLGSVEHDHSRFGICCPNTGFQTYFLALLDELNSRYECSGFWIDMIGWFDHICYCPACRERFRRETGFSELPETIDWNSPEWLHFQHCREQWLAEFAAKIRATVRARTPDRSVALQCSSLLTGWGGALSPEFLRESDYLAADLYSDQYEQSFVCKLFRAFSPHQPIEFMVPRCENLAHHTTIRSEANLEMRSYASLANQASFTLIDAIDPAGTLDPRFYQTAGRINRNLKRFRNGLDASSVPVADVGIYYDIASAADMHQAPLAVEDFRHDLSAYRRMIHLLRALQERHLLVAFTGRHQRNILSRFRVIVLSEAARLSREDCEILSGYVHGGGRLYVSGASSLFDPLEGLRNDFLLAPLLGVRFTGQWFPKGYYQKPAPSEGEQETPPVVSDFPQPRIAVAAPDAEVLATVAAPYSDAEELVRFGSAISNPPEYDTGIPSLIRRRAGAGCVVYSAAVIEREGYDFHRACFAERIEALLEGKRILSSSAPGAVEFTLFRQAEKQCWILSLLHFTTELPPPPLYGISVSLRLPESLCVKRICPVGEGVECEIPFRWNGELLEFELEKLEKFAMLRIETEALT